ncbi:Type II secretion system protein F [Symmachiella macrocystis]|uniref:General secretion pathway protein F n=1 Tax=Symmachiella macrocystis TaxID=2527985 RepID=A0A5C6BCV2_9PLAN|nr:type II secretion system F family protein [Symmachiella macrocystis]TWU09109.1 Type II secretion system protein F [Symmachiella macrocystis]
MPEFAYTARNMTGEDVVGSITAGSRREALNTLAERALFPVRVDSTEKAKSLFDFKLSIGRKIKAEVLASTLTQLSDLLENGVPLLNSLKLLSEQCAHDRMKEVLTAIHDQVVEGAPLDEAFAQHPEVFGELTVSMVRAGSEGAFLEDALKRTADFLELQEEMKSRVKGAMAYPAFLAAAGFVVTVVLIVFFVPKFAELFKQLEKQGGLPTPTVVLLALSDFLGRWGIFLIAGLFALGSYVKKQLAKPAGRHLVDRWKLKIPVAGSIFLGSAVSRFCRVLGTLLRNGVPLLRALEISQDSTGNLVLADAIKASAENISSGDTLSQPLGECGLIPKPVMAMIKIAEESNNLENVLINVADGIDRKIGRQIDIMVRLVEPTMLMVMGTVILFVLVALLLPVFDMSATM